MCSDSAYFGAGFGAGSCGNLLHLGASGCVEHE